jgi:DNA recombination protein RmuC
LQATHLRESLEEEKKYASERLQFFNEMLESKFKSISNDLMTRHGQTFTNQNKDQIDTLLTPLREKLVEFQRELQTAKTDSTKERDKLSEQIQQLSEKSANMTLETANLTRALKGQTQTQGGVGGNDLGFNSQAIRTQGGRGVRKPIQPYDGRQSSPDA